MAVDKILEKEYGFGFWDAKPFARLKVHCSCGKKYRLKEEFSSPNGDYVRKIKCPNLECGDVSYIGYQLSYHDEGPRFIAEIVSKEAVEVKEGDI